LFFLGNAITPEGIITIFNTLLSITYININLNQF